LSGVFEHITRSYPFGSKSQLPLYNIEEVDTLAKKFVRFDAAIAFETIKRKTPLLQAWEGPEYSDPARDTTCPKCSGMAVRGPQENRIWCPTDGIILPSKTNR
jgi:hypothetical protein